MSLALPLFAMTLLASGPMDSLTLSQPQARVTRSPEGWVTVATHLSTKAYGGSPEEAARTFLREHGAAFGLRNLDDGLNLANTPAANDFSTVVFYRTVKDLRVFNGAVMVAVTPEGRVHSASSSGPLPTTAHHFMLSEEQARERALARLDGDVVEFTKGWSIRGSELRPEYLVGIVAQLPYRSHRFMVDGETGVIGPSPSLLESANKATLYRISPSKREAPQAACTKTTDAQGKQVYSKCAMPEDANLLGLASGSRTLTGAPMKGVGRTTVYNCRGSSRIDTSSCTQSVTANASGDFAANLDYGTSTSDTGGEVMAYFHVDRHSRFMDSLDRTFSGLPLIPGFTNAYQNNQPLDNACFDPQNKRMVFGQGSTTDFAYDGEVIYHEMTHATCGAIGDSQMVMGALAFDLGPRGMYADPFAINEGNADVFAAMEPMSTDPDLGEFLSGAFGTTAIRTMAPPTMKTCQGNGTSTNPGRDGESHDDGEAWSNFAYEAYVGMKDLPNSAQQPGGSAAPAPMMKALQSLIAVPVLQESFPRYADLFSSQVRAMYGANAGDYVDCLKARHDLAKCDDAVTVYSGEGPFNDQYVQNAWKVYYYDYPSLFQSAPPTGFGGFPAAIQWKITVPTGATELTVEACDLIQSGKVYLRKGQPVSLDYAPTPWTVSASRSASYGSCSGGSGLTLRLTPSGCTGCSTGGTGISNETLSAGDWYILAANTGTRGMSIAKFNFRLAGTGIPSRPTTRPVTCRLQTTPVGDAGTPDAGPGSLDAGPGQPDSGVASADAGSEPDAGSEVIPDSGPKEMIDGGHTEQVQNDGGTSSQQCDGGSCLPERTQGGCGCTSGWDGMLGFLVPLMLAHRRRRSIQRM